MVIECMGYILKFKRNGKITLKYAANMHKYYDEIKLKENSF